MRYKTVLRFVLRLNALCTILSPWAFVVIRRLGIVDTEHFDLIIFAVLFFAASIVAILSFGQDE